MEKQQAKGWVAEYFKQHQIPYRPLNVDGQIKDVAEINTLPPDGAAYGKKHPLTGRVLLLPYTVKLYRKHIISMVKSTIVLKMKMSFNLD